MAQLITVRLSRGDAQPWGLRLQGGKDFGTPLVVQKVNIGSIADQAGLIAGDSVIKVNNVDVFSLRHKDAQDIIVRSGNSFEITVQRGGSTWRPSVTPTGAIPSPTPSYGNHINTVTKTSLAHKQQDSQHIGCGYNNAARPFQNGNEPVKSIVNKQYNTPVGIYSEESIAETLSAQAEVLAGGVLGVNFKKNEKVYNSAGSEVLKALQESENDPADPDEHLHSQLRPVTPVTKHVHAPENRPAPPSTGGLPAGQNICAESGTNFYWTASHAVGGAASALSRSHTPSQFQVACESNKNGNENQEELKSEVKNSVPVPPKPATTTPIQPTVVSKTEQSAKVSPCDECGASIVGVFVRIKDKNLHVDCFKCATCGTSLKNQGYFNLNNKLYCDIHAKMAAISNPPPGTEGFKPVPIAPNTKLSANTISAALSAHHGNLPHQNGTSHNNNHDYLLPNHSRTSSSASSFGSSYVSSTDSNKASPSTVSPVHSRQGSQNSTTSNLSINFRQNADEIDKNVINASYHNNSTLPRYQSVFNAEIKGYYNDNGQKSSILDDINAKEKSFVDGDFNGKMKNGNDDSIYGTIRSMDDKDKENEDVIYRTMDGGVIRSVHPPGKGKGTKYQLPSNLGSPKPYSYGSGPPQAGPKSPSSYPPPNWSQPKQQSYAPPQQTYAPPQQTYAPPQQTYAPPQQTYAPPKPTSYAPPQNYSSPASNFNSNNFGSNTLPRSVGQSAPEESSNPPPPPVPQPRSNPYDTYEEDSVDEFSRPSTSAFSWPPPPDDDHDLPTASPLYIAPPETQHVQVKTLNNSDNVEKAPATWLAQQSRSAPELTVHNLKEHNEAESCSESYTSTCTTTTTTSEEYQKMYRAHQAEFGCDQSVSDMDYHADAEMASMAQQYGSFSSASTDLISFAGRRSVQECTDALSNKLDTCQLIHYIRELEHANQKPVKKVEFADPVHKDINDDKKISKMEVFPQPASPKPLPPSNISNPVPKEWKSMMVQALTTAPSQPYHVSELQIESCNMPCQQPNVQNEVCYKTCPGKEICERVSCGTVELSKIESQESKITSITLQQSEENNFCRKENSENTGNEYNYDQNENNYLRLTDASCSNQTVETAPFTEEEPPKGSYMASVLTVASPYPVEWTKPFEDPIPLPEETVPYFPPPIDMTPYEKGEYGKKSPFIDALTTAPFRSYTPFEHDVITQLEDLPTPTQELSMIDALTVAPTDSYNELNHELPPVTAYEQIEIVEKERLQKQAQEVSEIIAQTIETQMDKQISAFAKFTGFRSVHPFKPRQDSVPSVSVDTTVKATEVSQSLSQATCTYTSSSSTQNTVSFPPPPGVKCKSYVQSGLNIPKTIPKYQRQWFNLPSQSPIRTPEPQELKENVPLAFVDVPHEKSDSVQKPVAVTVSFASTTEETQSNSFENQSQQYRTTVSTTIPSIQEFQPETVSVPIQSLESADKRENQRAVSPYRAHTPSLINKHVPAIPYYQQNLVAEECSATPSLLFDPRIQSPHPDRCKSPAPGPPPNPLRIHAPRIKSPDLAEHNETVKQSIDTGISNQFQTQSSEKLLSQYQTLNQSGMQSYVAKPEVVQQSQIGNVCTQSRSNQSEFNEQNRSDFQNSSTTQLGNTQIQRNTRVVEEFEHSQKAKTVEVYKSSGGPPIRSITAEPAVIQPSTPKTSCFLQKSGQTDLENTEEKVSVKSSGPGFVAREARRLSTNSQYKADLAEYQSSFPQFKCETPPCAFPIKSFHPIAEEPKFQTYNVNKRDGVPATPPVPPPLPKSSPPKLTSNESENYKKGHATELLEESVKNLKVSQQEDFRSHAGKIISFMLENRLADSKNGIPNRYHNNGKITDVQPLKKIITDPTLHTTKTAMPIGYENKPLLSPTLVKANSPDINDNLTDFPLPPPIPPAENINLNNYPPSPPPPPPSSDELDPPVFDYKYFSATKPTIKSQSKSPMKSSPQSSSPTSPKSVENENIPNNVVVRNKDSKSELSTHARDRRSYIERDMLGNDNYSNNIISEVETTDLAIELKDGKHPVCTCCNTKITRGPFITALGRIWCPDHFVCVSQSCRRPLADIGFVEEKGDLYCEYCFEKYLAPPCDKCGAKIKGDCLNAIGKHYHPECFVCTYCGKLFGNSPFFLEEGQAYCEADWNELFTTKCFACGFPVEAGDRWVEALAHNYHSQCFNCTMCKKNLEGQSFFAKGGRPYCKNHAR